jgi:hypothetical protein
VRLGVLALFRIVLEQLEGDRLMGFWMVIPEFLRGSLRIEDPRIQTVCAGLKNHKRFFPGFAGVCQR